MTRLLLTLLTVLLTLTACPMTASPDSVPPRNMALKAFDPHRKSFECRHEADAVPPIDPEAEVWFQEGMRVTSRDLWSNQRDYPKAVTLWAKAAERKHWKAMINLAGVLIEGDGTEPYVVSPDTERAVRIVEEAMKLGIPAAFDLMGSYHQRGLGVKPDTSRAYAFWELAADKGSPGAQTFLGRALLAAYDNPEEGIWSNREIGMRMVQCAYAQGHGKAAYELSLEYEVIQKDYARAVPVLHEGVKMGSEDSANSLGSIFDSIAENKGAPATDHARADRYRVLANALYFNPDLRLPNLDKVLPLPPAPLPKWDGNKKTLIDAAKGVVPTPGPASAPPAAPQRTDRAFIPEGFVLPETPQSRVPAQWETTSAPVAGYWLARLMHPCTERQHQWNADQLPLRYAEGELFDRTRPGLVPEDGRIQFHYMGQPVSTPPAAALPANPRVAQGVAREVDQPEPALQCTGDHPCPATGIWQARVADDHPLAATFNQWHRQSYVEKGQPWPDPRALYLDIESQAIAWTWWGQANEERPAGVAHVGLGNPRG